MGVFSVRILTNYKYKFLAEYFHSDAMVSPCRQHSPVHTDTPLTQTHLFSHTQTSPFLDHNAFQKQSHPQRIKDSNIRPKLNCNISVVYKERAEEKEPEAETRENRYQR